MWRRVWRTLRNGSHEGERGCASLLTSSNSRPPRGLSPNWSNPYGSRLTTYLTLLIQAELWEAIYTRFGEKQWGEQNTHDSRLFDMVVYLQPLRGVSRLHPSLDSEQPCNYIDVKNKVYWRIEVLAQRVNYDNKAERDRTGRFLAPWPSV